MISIVTYPSGDNLRGDDMTPAWISAQGEYLTDGSLEDLISDSSKTPILTRF